MISLMLQLFYMKNIYFLVIIFLAKNPIIFNSKILNSSQISHDQSVQ
ncbi:hypothetical protein pb186bvf_005608 [Paramecium bursaria]